MVRKLALFLALNLLVSSLIALPVHATPAMPSPGYSLMEINNVPSPPVSSYMGGAQIRRNIRIEFVDFPQQNAGYTFHMSEEYIVAGIYESKIVCPPPEEDTGDGCWTVTNTTYPGGFVSLGTRPNPANFMSTSTAKTDAIVKLAEDWLTYKDSYNPALPEMITNIFLFYRPLNPMGGEVPIYSSQTDTGACRALRNAVSDPSTCVQALLSSKEIQAIVQKEGTDVAGIRKVLDNAYKLFMQKKTESAQIPLPALVSSLFSITQDAVCSP